MNLEPRVRSKGWWMAVSVVLLVSGCGGSNADDVDSLDSTKSSQSSSTSAGGVVGEGTDEALALWVDDLSFALEDLVAAQAGEPVDPFNLNQADAYELLEAHKSTIDEVENSLLGPPPEGELLARRYADLETAFQTLSTSAVDLVEPAESGLIEGGVVRSGWNEAQLDVEDACFELQKALDESGLSLGGCVGLSTGDDIAIDAYQSQAAEGIELLGDFAFPGADVQSGDSAKFFKTDQGCRIPNTVLDGRVIDDFAFAVEAASATIDGNLWLLEVWAFPDTPTRRGVEDVLAQMFDSRKECLQDGALSRITAGFDGESREVLNLGSSTGFQVTGIESIEGPTLFAQFAYAAESNVIAAVSVAGEGEPPSASQLDEVTSTMTVGGTRP